MEEDGYINSLKWKLETIKKEISSLQEEIQERFKIIEQKQQLAHHITELLSNEDIELKEDDKSTLGQVPISEVVYEYMDNQDENNSIHYKDLANHLLSEGVLIPGKNPAANLLSHINRDQRFIRVSPGTYALKKWGLKPAPTRRSKKRTRSKK